MVACLSAPRSRGACFSAGRFIVRSAVLLVATFRNGQAARRQPTARLRMKLKGGGALLGSSPLCQGAQERPSRSVTIKRSPAVLSNYHGATSNEHWAKAVCFPLASGL